MKSDAENVQYIVQIEDAILRLERSINIAAVENFLLKKSYRSVQEAFFVLQHCVKTILYKVCSANEPCRKKTSFEKN